MKTSRRVVRTVIALGSVVGLSAWSSASPIRIAPESKLWVEGTSNVRNFTCRAAALPGQADGGPGATSLALQDLDRAVRSLDLRISVQGLDCSNGTMNSHMRKAFNVEVNPTIEYRLGRYEVHPNGSEGANVTLHGQLKMAGQEKPVTIEATVVPVDDGGVRVTGSQDILMSEYGMKAPSLMMGTMKVRDRVQVHFDVVLKP